MKVPLRAVIAYLRTVLPPALIFAFLPGGWWLTLGGGVRWLWGLPFWVLEVHGRSPISGYVSWSILDFSVNVLIWIIVMIGLMLLAKKTNQWTRQKVGVHFGFLALVSTLVGIYGILAADMLYIFLRYL